MRALTKESVLEIVFVGNLINFNGLKIIEGGRISTDQIYPIYESPPKNVGNEKFLRLQGQRFGYFDETDVGLIIDHKDFSGGGVCVKVLTQKQIIGWFWVA